MPWSGAARLVATMRRARPPRGGPRAPPAGHRHHAAGTSEAAGGGICIAMRAWPPIDVIEPRDPAEWSDWFEAMRFRTAISGGVGTSSREGGGAKADAVGLEACALTRCVWTTMGPDGGIGGARTGAKLFAT